MKKLIAALTALWLMLTFAAFAEADPYAPATAAVNFAATVPESMYASADSVRQTFAIAGLQMTYLQQMPNGPDEVVAWIDSADSEIMFDFMIGGKGVMAIVYGVTDFNCTGSMYEELIAAFTSVYGEPAIAGEDVRYVFSMISMGAYDYEDPADIPMWTLEDGTTVVMLAHPEDPASAAVYYISTAFFE